MIIDRFNEAICACCARSATGLGYTPNARKPVLWICDDPDCIQLAKDSYTMKAETFTRIESLAAGKGGEEGGAFLDHIGKSDLTHLTPDEWFEFCRRIVAGYRKALAVDLRDAAPF